MTTQKIIRLIKGTACYAALFSNQLELGWLALPFTNEAPEVEVIAALLACNPNAAVQLEDNPMSASGRTCACKEFYSDKKCKLPDFSLVATGSCDLDDIQEAENVMNSATATTESEAWDLILQYEKGKTTAAGGQPYGLAETIASHCVILLDGESEVIR